MEQRCQYQFELWEECNSKCKFCYLGKANNITPKETKLHNLDSTITKISDLSLYQHVNGLAYIGGEFFQGQLNDDEVQHKFMELMCKTNALLEAKHINEVWISASLTIGDQLDLYKALSCYSDLSKVWILTSYDTMGRFHSEKMKADWLRNLTQLRAYSKDIHINVTSILTGDFIQKYLTDTLDIRAIAENLKCAIFWKPPCSIGRQDFRQMTKQQTNIELPGFFPSRQQFLEFLLKYKAQETTFLYDKLFNMQYRSDYLEKYTDGFKLSHRIKDKSVEAMDTGCQVLKCGHSSQYQIYIDSDACAICDKEKIRSLT